MLGRFVYVWTTMSNYINLIGCAAPRGEPLSICYPNNL